MSGKYLELAAMSLDAMRLWEKQVNQQGGLLGRPVQLVLYDDQSQSELARKFYHKLIFQDKVDLVLAPYGTPLTLAALQVTEPQKLVMVTGSASGDTIWQRGYRYIFGIHSPGGRYLIGFLDVMARQGLGSVAILYENTAFNIAVAQGGRDWAQRLGLKISYFQAYQGNKELPRLLPQCLATRPDGLILCSYPEDSYTLLALLKHAKFRPQAICATIAPGLPGFQQRVGNNMAERVFGPSLWEPDIRIPYPGTREFIGNFTELAHRPPSYHAASAYAACKILEKGIKHNQSLDQEKLRDYIRSLDTVTIVGRFRVDSTGMQVAHSPLLIQWQHGKKEIVYPNSMQTAPPRF